MILNEQYGEVNNSYIVGRGELEVHILCTYLITCHVSGVVCIVVVVAVIFRNSKNV